MKRLQIKLDNTQCYKGGRSLMVKLEDGEALGLEELIIKNLPSEIADYKNFICDISLEINVFEPVTSILANYDLEVEED